MNTKIIATLGPASSNRTSIRQMAGRGVRVFRLNFSHGDAASFAPNIEMIRAVERELDLPLTVMADLSGPKIRIGEVEGSPAQVSKDDIVCLGLEDLRDKSTSPLFAGLNIAAPLRGLQVGMPVVLSDGMLRFMVTRCIKEGALYEMQAVNDGLLASRKGIAFPGKFHPLPALTAKDRKDLHEGLEAGIDAVAMSFVQSGQDVNDVRNEIAKHDLWIPLVAKVERQAALDNLADIVKLADVVMVARGDLGVECPMAELPIIQKRIVRACRHAQKSVIIATQMLLSMVKSPVPTRAEATDVANAILDGADCVMLSEETTIGEYPVDAVQFINEVAHAAEAYYREKVKGPYTPAPDLNTAKYLAYSACLLSEHAASAALACHTKSGVTARILSSRRPNCPIYGLTPDPRVVHALNFYRGVVPRLIETSEPDHLLRVEEFVQTWPAFEPGENVIITSGQPTPGQPEPYTNTIKIYYK